MKTWAGVIAVLMVWLSLAATAHADPVRLALVINQVDYQKLTPLPDTDTEASEMTGALKQIGFDVTSVRDATIDGSGGHPNLKRTPTAATALL